MPSVNIGWPKEKKPVPLTSHGVFVASGRASGDVLQVVGACWPIGDDDRAHRSEGKSISYVENCRGEGPDKNRWAMMFRLQDPIPGGRYRLEVEGWNEKGKVVSDGVDFVLQGPTLAISTTLAITTTWPINNEDITDVRAEFVPYGDLVQFPLGAVTMTPASGSPILPSYSYGDYTDYFCWYAQFPIIGQGTYTLSAQDTNPNGTPSITTGLRQNHP